jgi:hypothetical protein
MVLTPGSTEGRGRFLDLAAPEQVIQAANAEPLIAVGLYRRARQCEHQADSELDVPTVDLHHGGNAAPASAIMELRRFCGTYGIEHHVSLLLRQAPEVELSVIAEEGSPCSCLEELSADHEIEHHEHAGASAAKYPMPVSATH